MGEILSGCLSVSFSFSLPQPSHLSLCYSKVVLMLDVISYIFFKKITKIRGPEKGIPSKGLSVYEISLG